MLVDYLRVFITGGVICALVQLMMEKTKVMPGRIMVLLVCCRRHSWHVGNL